MRTCLILDDYQQAALALADWTRLSDRVAVSAIAQHIANPDDLVARIAQAEILVIMRERTPFPAALLERLPRLELLVTSGMRNLAIDLAAARARNVVVCGGTAAIPAKTLPSRCGHRPLGIAFIR